MRKIITCLASFLIVLVLASFTCPAAYSEPYLWSAHNSAVDMKDGKADLSTARFFCVTLEIADDDNELPELAPPAYWPYESFLTLEGGNYSYWSKNKMENVSGTQTEFFLMRNDYGSGAGDDTYYRAIYTNTPGYAPINYEGKKLHFINNADTGLNNVNVSWRYGENQTTGSAVVPEFLSTSEQLAGIVPYVEYVINESGRATGLNWRFVKASDTSKAVSTDVAMTIEIRGCYSNGTGHNDDFDFILYDGTEKTLVTISSGDVLEGSINFEGEIDIPYHTVLRYYADNEKGKCYQWRYFTYSNDPFVRFYSDAMIKVPIKDGKLEYNRAYYSKTDIGVNIFDIVNEAKYLTEGKFTIEAGGYSLLDNLDIEIDEIKDGETKTFSIYPTAQTLGDNGCEYGIYRDIDHPFNGEGFWEWTTGFADETGEKLSGAKVSWTFPDELSGLNGSAEFPKYTPIKEMLSPEGFFPYVELVMDGTKVTGIKYRFVQSPDIESVYTPEILCYFDGVGIHNSDNVYQGTGERPETFTTHHSGEFTFDEPIEYERINQIQAYVTVFPGVANTQEALNELLDSGAYNDNTKSIRYGWVSQFGFSDSRAVLIDSEDFNNMAGSIANALSTDSANVNNVMRDEFGGDSTVTDEVKSKLESGDIELLGGFKGIMAPDSGNYAAKVNVLFNSELLEELQGTASSDLHIYPVTPEDLANGIQSQASGLARISSTQATGKLLNEEGKTFNTVNAKKFIVALSLPKSDYYNIYIARSKNKPQTPKEVIEIISQDESQKIDSGTKDKLINIISGDNKNNYEIKTFNELAASGDITNYRPGAKPDSATLDTLSKDFTGFELVDTLPAFTLSVDKPVILIMKVSADLANQASLHFYKRKGAVVTGVSRQVVKLSAAVDMSEDKEAKFYDNSGNQITKLTANTVYVSSVFDKGSYAPLVITGEVKSDSREPIINPEDPSGDKTLLTSSSGGCNSGLFASGALMLAVLIFVKKSN